METHNSHYKAGFVNIIGEPNVGKSTLVNALLGAKLSIITAKVQTTRHRIMGIFNGDNFQIIYSDTPGMLTPKYELQECMMHAVNSALSDADVFLWVVSAGDKELKCDIKEKLEGHTAPVFLIINKVDLLNPQELEEALQYWTDSVKVKAVIPISALNGHNVSLVFDKILEFLPIHPPYYPKDILSDRPERFFAAEIVREKILNNYHQEIPYSVEVVIEEFKELEKIIRIRCVINVERQSQKYILIGKQGLALKKVGTEARHSLEAFFNKKVFLQQYVKVATNWRREAQHLRQFGYK